MDQASKAKISHGIKIALAITLVVLVIYFIVHYATAVKITTLSGVSGASGALTFSGTTSSSVDGSKLVGEKVTLKQSDGPTKTLEIAKATNNAGTISITTKASTFSDTTKTLPTSFKGSAVIYRY